MFSVCTACTIESSTTVSQTGVSENVTQFENAEQTVTLSQDTIDMAEDTVSYVNDGEDIATDELPDSSAQEEATIEDEQAIEQDAQVEQENISYNGTNTGNGQSLLGKCSGLTYYSQADSRWASVLYTSTGNKSQTMKSSACGPTSAAMVVSSSKGAILPTTMAQLFVDNGYRTASNGTAWACWSFIADYFGFDEYKTTTSFSTAEKALETDDNKDGVSDYFVVVSVGSGLFTTGGHYIVLVGDNDNTLTVYDPYLYSGKFSTASRKAANVTVSGNSVFVSESSFKKYANAKQYWIFSNDNEVKSTSGGSAKQTTSGTTKSTSTAVKYTRYVATQSKSLNVRKSATTSSAIVTTVKRGAKVTVAKTSGSWSYITYPVTGWVSTAYLSASEVTTASAAKTNSKVAVSYNVGSVYTLTADLKVRTGAGTSYAQKKRSQLTASGRKNAYGGTYAVLKKGTKVTVQQVKKVGSDIWVKIPSGWIAGYYNNNIYVK